MPANAALFDHFPRIFRKASLLIVFCLVAAIFPKAEAHGGSSGPLAKQSVEKQAGKYIMRIGINAPRRAEGDDVLFDAFLMEDGSSMQWKVTSYDAVRLTVKKGEVIVKEKDIPNAKSGPTVFSERFDVAGKQDVTIGFLADDRVIAEYTFPISISKKWGIKQIVDGVIDYLEIGMILACLCMVGIHLFEKRVLLPFEQT